MDSPPPVFSDNDVRRSSRLRVKPSRYIDSSPSKTSDLFTHEKKSVVFSDYRGKKMVVISSPHGNPKTLTSRETSPAKKRLRLESDSPVQERKMDTKKPSSGDKVNKDRSRSRSSVSVVEMEMKENIDLDLNLVKSKVQSQLDFETQQTSQSKKVKSENETDFVNVRDNYHDTLSDDDVDDQEKEVFSYLKLREENMKANKEFFEKLGMDKVKEMFHESVGTKKNQPTQRGLKIKKEPAEPLPRRSSLRIRRIDPEGNALPEPEPVPQTPLEERLPSGPVAMKDCVYSKQSLNDEEVKSEAIFSSLSSYSECSKKAESCTTEFKDFLKRLNKASINESGVAKVVPGRVFSLTWHPSHTSLIAAAGDKYGHVGLWDVMAQDSDGNDIVTAFKPHIKPVSDVYFPPFSQHKMYTCSYDATLRCGDFEKKCFDEIFSVPEDEDDLFRNFNFIDDSNTLLVSHFSGVVSLVDVRTRNTSAEKVFPVSRKSLRTVSVHPTESNYFITAGVDTNIDLWDLRSISTKCPKPIQTKYEHTKAISSAYFSPDTGHKILSCSADDSILVYNVSSSKNIELTKRIRHNNHTGRWLTKFQPVWHPFVPEVFVTGSMVRPRQIEVWGSDGTMIAAKTNEDYLGSVCSLNVFHPNKPFAMVGANSSGRLHAFM